MKTKIQCFNAFTGEFHLLPKRVVFQQGGEAPKKEPEKSEGKEKKEDTLEQDIKKLEDKISVAMKGDPLEQNVKDCLKVNKDKFKDNFQYILVVSQINGLVEYYKTVVILDKVVDNKGNDHQELKSFPLLPGDNFSKYLTLVPYSGKSSNSPAQTLHSMQSTLPDLKEAASVGALTVDDRNRYVQYLHKLEGFNQEDFSKLMGDLRQKTAQKKDEKLREDLKKA